MPELEPPWLTQHDGGSSIGISSIERRHIQCNDSMCLCFLPCVGLGDRHSAGGTVIAVSAIEQVDGD